MSELNLKVKVRGIRKEYAHPAELGQFLIENADKIKYAVVLVDYEDGDSDHTRESYAGPWKVADLAWWIACLQSTLMRKMG